jgi:hypothetical protein
MEKLSCKSISALRDELPEPPPFVQLYLTPGFESLPDIIAWVRKYSFSGLPSENPYHHLLDFEHLCSCLGGGKERDTFMWKIFPYSLVDKAKCWYMYTVGSMNDNWDELRDKFCLEFFPPPRINAPREDIRCFR